MSGILGDGDEEEVNIYRNKILVILPQIWESQQIEMEMYPSAIEEFSLPFEPLPEKNYGAPSIGMFCYKNV